jgi:hypothetical protein
MGTKKTVRLRINYATATNALREITRNLHRGTVILSATRDVALGTTFVFELNSEGAPAPVEVRAEIVGVRKAPSGGGYLVTLKYDHGDQKEGYYALLKHVFENQRADPVRKQPRLPLHVVAQSTGKTPVRYLLRDLSAGGIGVEVESAQLPSEVKVGLPFLLEIDLPPPNGIRAVHGEVSWVALPAPGKDQPVHPSFGVSFGKLRDSAKDTIKRLLLQRDLPPPPWKAQVSFGNDAISRMP